MAANYWASTQHRHWQFNKDGLARIRQELEDEERELISQYPLPDRRLLSQFINHQLAKLGKRMSVRQQALATAQIYIKRFYTKVEIRRSNPYLVIATALYLACKMEECQQHIRAIVSEARQIWTADLVFSDIAKVGECEFSLISEMNSQLIIHHPYRTLSELHSKLGMGQDEQSLAWSIINDHYLTDAPLLYPPHVVAVTAIFLAMTLKPTPGGLAAVASAAANLSGGILQGELQAGGTNTPSPQQKKVENLVKWLAEGEIDIKAVIECSQEIISLYDVLDQYNEKLCKEQIARFVKARGLDK